MISIDKKTKGPLVSVEEETVYKKTLGATDSAGEELGRVEHIILQLAERHSEVRQQWDEIVDSVERFLEQFIFTIS